MDYTLKTDSEKNVSWCRIELRQEALSCPEDIQKAEELSEEVMRRKTAGETNRETAESYGLKKTDKRLGKQTKP